MATTTLKNLKQLIPVVLAATTAWHFTVAAQNSSLPKKSATETSNSSGGMKFNTDAEPKNSDTRAPMIFKDGASSPSAPAQPPKVHEMDQSIAEDAPFKTYLGYPKHQAGAFVSLINVSSVWKRDSKEYSFSSGATGYGLRYGLIATPQFMLDIDYSQYSLSIDAANLGGGLRVLESEESYSNYFLRGNYCWISNSSFFRRFCTGFDIGNDSYAVLRFQTGTDLVLGRTNDIMIGPNVSYQVPFTDNFLGRIVGGFNYGTGVGNSGSLTSKSNMAYYGRLQLEWNILHGVIGGGAEYKMRTAELEGTIGNNKIKWETETSSLAFTLGYSYQF